MLPKIEFEWDEPVALTLRHAQGFKVASRYYERWPGDTEQYLFFALEGVFYLSDTAGGLLNARLRARGIAAGDAVFIKIKARNPNSTRAVIEYVPLKMLGNSDDEFRGHNVVDCRCPEHARFKKREV